MQPTHSQDASQPAAANSSTLPSVPPAAPVLASQPNVAPVTPVAPATTPAIADDNDLIEKEWVVQVKQILAANAGNPYEQNQQLTKLKADYMQKRYGKDLKVDS